MRWHTNKTQPNAERFENIILVYKNGEIDWSAEVEVGRCTKDKYDYLWVANKKWKEIKNNIIAWQYVSELEKEITKSIQKRFKNEIQS